MAVLVDYRGLQVIDGGPSGAGGAAIQDDLMNLVDWHPRSVWDESANPGAADDEDSDFFPGSFWMNTNSTPTSVFVCQDSPDDAAVWVQLLAALVQDAAPKLGGHLDVNGQTITSASNGNICLMPNGSGRVGIGTTSPSALLDVASTTQGFLPPRMTTTQRNAMTSPAEGLVIYNLTTHKLNVYTGSAWEEVTSS